MRFQGSVCLTAEPPIPYGQDPVVQVQFITSDVGGLGLHVLQYKGCGVLLNSSLRYSSVWFLSTALHMRVTNREIVTQVPHLPEVHGGVQGGVPRHWYRLDERVLGRGGAWLASGLEKYHTATARTCPGKQK